MDKSKKLYIKALDKYNNGYIDNAIELCEESISMDIKNAASINLKGLLCYLKGDLDSAQKLWKMNYGVNKDGVSERYLNDSGKDKEKLKLYTAALDFIKELKINEAQNLLQKCTESDFNYINVNNHISVCYMKRGQYDKALEYVEKVLTVDRTNIMAKEIIKTLRNSGAAKKNTHKINSRYILIFLACLSVCIIASTTYIKLKKSNSQVSIKKLFSMTLNKEKETPKNAVKQESSADLKSKNEKDAKIQKDKIVQSKIQNEIFPSDKVKGYIESKNFEAIYDEHTKWKDKAISVNDKVILSKAADLLKNEGVSYFYEKGCTYSNNKDYNNGKAYLLKAYEIGKESYLYPHIIYMTGNDFYLSGDVENAIKYYTQYDQEFSKGNYEDTVLYNLAIMYKDIDKSKAKSYAEKLLEGYPQSIYNNSISRSIANR